jgi:type IV secretion system protein VirB2
MILKVLMNTMTRKSRSFALALLMMIGVGMAAPAAFATTQDGTATATTSNITELTGPLASIQQTIQGPIAMSIGVVALAVAGAMLIFGGEFSDFAKRLVYTGAAVALTVSAASILTSVFTTTSGALI